MSILRHIFISSLYALAILVLGCSTSDGIESEDVFVEQLISQMTLDEKLGQLNLLHSPGADATYELVPAIREGKVGAILNETRPEVIRVLQQEAVNNSRLGIPLLFGRDVIHGFKTIFPINIGLAATFDPQLVMNCAEVSAVEATYAGVNWNFAPMVDISRDPRWGRMAESFGEDPLLVTRMGLAMYYGFRGNDPDHPRMLSCAKHFAGYGAAEGGRDYNTASIPQIELWNTYLKPFKALNDAGISTFMTGFNELNGVPASGNEFLLRNILKGQWGFEGFVVSDWASVTEMVAHGYAADNREAAVKAIAAGLDMEMASTAYKEYLPPLVQVDEISKDLIDDAVRRILTVKYKLGLFDDQKPNNNDLPIPWDEHLELAKEACIRSLVLLKNQDNILPLKKDIQTIAVIGPMAHDRYEQMGTWIFDGDTNLSITPLEALQEAAGRENIRYAKGLTTTRSNSREGFPDAIRAARISDAIIVFAGEESIITGEAHSRAYLDFPGLQDELIIELSQLGKPLILVVMTPRPLCIGDIISKVNAVLYAWHPGTMGGPAIADILTGNAIPSGKLPVTFPKAPGQIPIYYSHKNTGRPPDPSRMIAMEDIPIRSFQTSLGNTSYYLDIGSKPLFPFGFGLSYSTFDYSNLILSSDHIATDDDLSIRCTLHNTGQYKAEEVVQLYVQDVAASITRPVKELFDFRRVEIPAGQSVELQFTINAANLGFFDREGAYRLEDGKFRVWVGGSSEAGLNAEFMLIQ